MSYKLEVRNRELIVEEVATEQILKRLDNLNEANTLVQHLNTGGAFDGWTPSFFLIDTSAYIPQPE